MWVELISVCICFVVCLCRNERRHLSRISCSFVMEPTNACNCSRWRQQFSDRSASISPSHCPTDSFEDTLGWVSHWQSHSQWPLTRSIDLFEVRKDLDGGTHLGSVRPRVLSNGLHDHPAQRFEDGLCCTVHVAANEQHGRMECNLRILLR